MVIVCRAAVAECPDHREQACAILLSENIPVIGEVSRRFSVSNKEKQR
jgi:hypothetical protein